MKCYNCGKVSRGNMPTAIFDNEERTYCADCYWKLEKEYKQKKTCDECASFSKDRCKKTNVSLTPITIGYNIYYTQAENCSFFSTDQKAFLEEAKKLEAEHRYEEAAVQYEKLGMTEKAGKMRKKVDQKGSSQFDTNAKVKELAETGQTLTYYCCHCGAPLKIGAKTQQIQRSCPRCKGDLEIINLGKLISQHLS